MGNAQTKLYLTKQHQIKLSPKYLLGQTCWWISVDNQFQKVKGTLSLLPAICCRCKSHQAASRMGQQKAKGKSGQSHAGRSNKLLKLRNHTVESNTSTGLSKPLLPPPSPAAYVDEMQFTFLAIIQVALQCNTEQVNCFQTEPCSGSAGRMVPGPCYQVSQLSHPGTLQAATLNAKKERCARLNNSCH